MSAIRPAGEWRRVHISEIHWVSSDGRLWSEKRGRLLKQSQRPDGYYVVNLGECGGHKPLRVHRLVAYAFFGEPEPEQEVRHLNGCPTDNRVENLAWGTKLENASDTLAHGMNVNVKKTHCPRGHAYDAANTRIRVHSNGRPARWCRTCDNARGRAKREAARLADDQLIARRFVADVKALSK